MKKRNHIKKISDYAMVGGLGALLVVGLTGCEDKGKNNQSQNQNSNSTFADASQKQGAFVVIEESADKKYKIVDEFPASKTTIILRKPDGTEKVLSQEEIDKLVKEENMKIDAGTSALTNPQHAQVSEGGMGLGGVLLSSLAGAVVGSWIGNKLFNNPNFQSQREAQYKSPQTYSKTQSSFNKPVATSGFSTTPPAEKKSGFFTPPANNTPATTNSTSSSSSNTSSSSSSSSSTSSSKSSSFSSPSAGSFGG